MKKVLFVAPSNSTFVLDDLRILKKKFQVRIINFSSRGNIFSIVFKNIINIIKLLWYIPAYDCTYTFFASHPAYFAVLFSRIFKKKSVVVPAGYSVVHIPEIDYGLLKSKFFKRFVLFILEKADLLLPISRDNLNDLLKLNIDPAKCPVISLGVQDDVKPEILAIKKKEIVLTVGEISKGNGKRKGQDAFIKAATLMPDTSFVIAGRFSKDIEFIKSGAPKNVVFKEFPGKEELELLYGQAQVYVQASRHESFGLSIAEAMLHQCVPVVTDKAAIPEVVEKTGYYVKYDDPQSLSDGIRLALKDRSIGRKARQRILNEFSFEKREKKILEIVESLI